MAKRSRITDPIAMGRIEHGEIVDGKNIVKTFEPGDIVDLEPGQIKGLIDCGAVQQLKPETPQEGGGPSAQEAAAREAFVADAKKRFEGSAALKKEFADFDAYLVSLGPKAS